MRDGSVSIDFEFRSGADIALGLPRYFADPEAEALCMAYDFGDELGASLWTREDTPDDLQALLDHVADGGLVRGWNVMFEWYVWNSHMVPRYGWPPLSVSQLVDSMAEAAAMNLPQALGKCASALGLPANQQKDKRGKALIKALCIPQVEPVVKPPEQYRSKGAHTAAVNRHKRWAEAGGRWINDAELFGELYDYCRQDVVTEQAIVRRLRRLSPYEQRVWVKTQEVNLRGVPVCVEEIRGIADVVAAEVDRLDEQLATLTAGEVTAGSQVGALLDWCNSRLPDGSQLLDLAGESVDAALLKDDLPEDVRRALTIRSQVGQTSTAKLPKMLEVVAPDGTLKNMHVYHGASTGRDASRGGVNLQNLKSPLLDGDEAIERAIETLSQGEHFWAHMLYGDSLMDAAVSTVRGVIKAPEGFEFTDGDFSSIENRMSAWISGQHDKLDLFRLGLDEYKTFATKIFGVAYEEVDKGQRKFAKPAILGGMFGQGAKGLVEYAAGMGVTLTLEDSEQLTDTYRAEYHKVAAMWKACGNAAIAAVRNPGTWFKAGEKVALRVYRNFLWMRLPSGRLIAWASPMVEDLPTPWGEVRPVVTVCQVDQFTRAWRRDKLIGSSIFQSAVQASARDLLMHGMFQLEDAGYAVILRVHDELLSCNPVGFGSVDHYIATMCRNPEWCADLPLAGEGWRARRFRK